jgi:hypothetical protein
LISTTPSDSFCGNAKNIGVPPTVHFSLPALLKTFSRSPFHGQYLKRAERTRIAPINPIPNQKIPEMKKERTIRILPKMDRTIDSCFPTFFVLTIGVTSSPYRKKLPS